MISNELSVELIGPAINYSKLIFEFLFIFHIIIDPDLLVSGSWREGVRSRKCLLKMSFVFKKNKSIGSLL